MQLKSVIRGLTNRNVTQVLLTIRREMSKKISRGQNPEVLAEMPVFQYTSGDKMPAKRKRRVYCWGYSAGGALGSLKLFEREYRIAGLPPPPPVEVKRAPMRMAFVDQYINVIDVAAGYGFTVIAAVASDTSHRVFGCGVNTDSQIGYHEAKRNKPLVLLASPVPIALPLNNSKVTVNRVACGRAHTVCLASDGKLFSLGNNAYGQCGRPIVEEEIYSGSRRIHQIQGIEDKVVDRWQNFCNAMDE